MNGNLGSKIKAIRVSLGLDQTEFGEAVGVSQSTVTRWEKGAKPQSEHLQRIAEMGKTTVERLLNVDTFRLKTDEIPVVGIVGAGAEIVPYDDHSQGGGFDHIERPPFITGRAVAVEVKGDSLFPVAENGWRLVYAGEQTMIEEDVLNKLCVVSLTDGRVMVKRVTRGSRPQRYHLVSTNAPMIEDAEILWAARVKAIIPN